MYKNSEVDECLLIYNDSSLVLELKLFKLLRLNEKKVVFDPILILVIIAVNSKYENRCAQ